MWGLYACGAGGVWGFFPRYNNYINKNRISAAFSSKRLHAISDPRSGSAFNTIQADRSERDPYHTTITMLRAYHMRRFLISFRLATLSCRRLQQNDDVEKRKDDIARACSKAYVVLTFLPAQAGFAAAAVFVFRPKASITPPSQRRSCRGAPASSSRIQAYPWACRSSR